MNYKTKVISINGVPTEVIEIPNPNNQALAPQVVSQNLEQSPYYTQTIEIPQQVYYQNPQQLIVNPNQNYFNNQNQTNFDYNPNIYQAQNYNSYNQVMPQFVDSNITMPINNQNQNPVYFNNSQQINQNPNNNQFMQQNSYSPQQNISLEENRIQQLRKNLAQSRKRNSNTLNQPMSEVLDDIDFNPSQLKNYVNSLSTLAQSKYKTLKYLLNSGNISMDEYLAKVRKIFMEDVDA